MIEGGLFLTSHDEDFLIQWEIDIMKGQGAVLYNEVSLYRGSFQIFHHYRGNEYRSICRGLCYNDRGSLNWYYIRTPPYPRAWNCVISS